MSKNSAVHEPLVAVPGPSAWVRHALGKGTLLALSICLCLAMGEIVARLALTPMRSVSWYHYDYRYGYRHRANADSLTTDWGDGRQWRFRTNVRGFRGNPWRDEEKAGTSRVVVMGDSFTFGNAIDEADTYPQVAQAVVGQNSGWEVVNAGVSAWGPQNALAFLETEGAPIEASCLVYGFFEGNDVIDGLVHHFYELDGNVAKRIAMSGPEPSSLGTVRTAMRKMPLYDYLLANSQLFNVVRSSVFHALARHDVKTPAPDPYTKTTRKMFDHALKLNDATLDRLLALARARFGAFALVLIPMRGQVTQSNAPTAVPFPLWIAEESHTRATAWAKANNVPVVDLREALAKVNGDVAKYYFTKDFHLSAEGSRLLGRALGERLPAICRKQLHAGP